MKEVYIVKLVVDNKNKRNIIGNRLRTVRKNQNITQQQLSDKLKLLNVMISRSAIAKIEIKVNIVTDIELLAFAKALNVSVEYLLQNGNQ